MSASLRRRLARLARLERRRGARPMRFVLVRPGEPEPEARAGELLFVMSGPATGSVPEPAIATRLA